MAATAASAITHQHRFGSAIRSRYTVSGNCFDVTFLRNPHLLATASFAPRLKSQEYCTLIEQPIVEDAVGDFESPRAYKISASRQILSKPMTRRLAHRRQTNRKWPRFLDPKRGTAYALFDEERLTAPTMACPPSFTLTC